LVPADAAHSHIAFSLPRGTEQPVDVTHVRREVVERLRVLEAYVTESLYDVSFVRPGLARLGRGSGGSLAGRHVRHERGAGRWHPPPRTRCHGDAVDVDSVADAAETVA